MSEPINNNQTHTPAPEPAPAPAAAQQLAERTFTQAELDAIVGRWVTKAMKGMPDDAELTAFRAWKESQQTEKERWDTLQKERDESKTALAEALARVEQFEREKILLGKGVKPDDVDYYAFKIGKLVNETTDFEKAAETYLKEHPLAGTVQVEFAAPLGGGQPAKNVNETIFQSTPPRRG